MANKNFIELYKETQKNHNTLHHMTLVDVNIWFVEQGGEGSTGTIESCFDFGIITCKGSVIITKEHGVYLKIDDQHWVSAGCGVTYEMLHDLDIIKFLIIESEDDHVATVIDPGM